MILTKWDVFESKEYIQNKMYLFTITSQHDIEDSMYCSMIWSNWKHIFQSRKHRTSMYVVVVTKKKRRKKSTLHVISAPWQPFFRHDLHTKLCLMLLVCSVLTRGGNIGANYTSLFRQKAGLFFHSTKKFYIWGRKMDQLHIIDFMRFHGFCKKEISLSWYVLSNYSKNADSWINGWIVSRLLRLLAGIEQTVSQMIMIRYYCTVITAIRQS